MESSPLHRRQTLNWEHVPDGRPGEVKPVEPYDRDFPMVSQALRDLVVNEWKFDELKFDPQGKAEFIFGLCQLYNLMWKVGEIEHTNDWDWFVQVELMDGTWLGDECQGGKRLTEDELEANDYQPFCDTISTPWDERSFQQLGMIEGRDAYYNGLTVQIVTDDNDLETPSMTYTFRMDQIKTIIIFER